MYFHSLHFTNEHNLFIKIKIMSKIKVTATTGVCGHLNVPTMASLTPHKNVHMYARL
jgi:hypothetical protein